MDHRSNENCLVSEQKVLFDQSWKLQLLSGSQSLSDQYPANPNWPKTKSVLFIPSIAKSTYYRSKMASNHGVYRGCRQFIAGVIMLGEEKYLLYQFTLSTN